MNTRITIICLLNLVAIGCGHSGPETVEVTGEVTFDGQLLPNGDILFVPLDGYPLPDSGKIEDGRYSLKARPGLKKVQIRASKIIPGGVLGSRGEPVPEDYVPKCYNFESVLTAELVPGNPNQFNFKLTSK